MRKEHDELNLMLRGQLPAGCKANFEEEQKSLHTNLLSRGMDSWRDKYSFDSASQVAPVPTRYSNIMSPFISFLLATHFINPVAQVFAISADLDPFFSPTTAPPADTPIPEEILHELRVLMNVTNDYDIAKRTANVLYQCGRGEVLSRAICDGNVVVTYCKPIPGWSRMDGPQEVERSRDDCTYKVCSPNLLGSNPPQAGCQSTDKTVSHVPFHPDYYSTKYWKVSMQEEKLIRISLL